jgi:DNA polymerase-1
LRLQDNGALISPNVRDKHKKDAEERAANALARLKELTGEDVNPNSPKQMKELLYDKLKFPSATNKEGKTTTDEEAIRQLAKRYPGQPVLQAIIDFRKATKLIGTYLEIPLGSDGRIRSSYNASGTETGRLSSGQDLFGNGMNLQNIPAGKGLDIVNIKDMFIAPPGRVLLKGDLKQAETMVVGEILDRLGFPQMHDHYQNPDFDVHRWAAAFTFAKEPANVTKNERNVCKIRNHSGNYMAGPHVMVKTALKYGVDIDYAMAKRLLEDHKKQVPGLTTWWYSVEKLLKTTRTLTNCFGRRRVFFGRLDESTTREAVAWEPQSTVGDLNNIILRNLFNSLPAGCFPILQVHDEIVIELPEDMLDTCIKCYREAALVPCFVSGKHALIIPVELSAGKDWKNTKDIK